MAILVEKPDGVKAQVEVKGSDKVKVIKAMLQMELGVAEELQDLSYADMPLEDDYTVADCGILQGSTLRLQVREEAIELRPEQGAIEGDVCVRIFVKCDISVSKSKVIALDVPKSDTMKDVKEKAYEAFTAIQENFKELKPRGYGLFLVKGPTVGDRGQLRYLRRDERIDEKKTLEENGLSGGEELIFANLFWCEA